jgi:hypothetical protein
MNDRSDYTPLTFNPLFSYGVPMKEYYASLPLDNPNDAIVYEQELSTIHETQNYVNEFM